MSTTKLTGRENLTKNTFCVGPVGPTDKENQVKMSIKKCTSLGTVHYLFETLRIQIRFKQPDPYQIEKHDPDPDQSEKQDPNPHKKGLDPQHCFGDIGTTLLNHSMLLVNSF